MQKSIFKNNYFQINELETNTSLLKVSLQYLVESNITFIIDSLLFMSDRGYSKVIIDISETEYLDRVSVTSLTNAIDELNAIGVKTRIVISKNKPRFIYSLGNPIPKVDFFLGMETALKDFVN